MNFIVARICQQAEEEEEASCHPLSRIHSVQQLNPSTSRLSPPFADAVLNGRPTPYRPSLQPLLQNSKKRDSSIPITLSSLHLPLTVPGSRRTATHFLIDPNSRLRARKAKERKISQPFEILPSPPRILRLEASKSEIRDYFLVPLTRSLSTILSSSISNASNDSIRQLLLTHLEPVAFRHWTRRRLKDRSTFDETIHSNTPSYHPRARYERYSVDDNL